MVRKLVCAVVLMAVATGVVAADEFDAIISKVEGSKTPGGPKVIHYRRAAYTRGPRVPPALSKRNYSTPVAKDVKILEAKFNDKAMKWEAGDPIAEGLNAPFFKDPGAKTLHVLITRRDDGKAITQILVQRVGGKTNREVGK